MFKKKTIEDKNGERDLGGEVLPKMKERKYKGVSVAPKTKPCDKDMPDGILSIGNEGLTPEEKLQSKNAKK